MLKLISTPCYLFCIFINLAFVSSLCIQVRPAFAWVGTVQQIKDGDTIIVKRAGRIKNQHVRLYGIDAPEIGQSYGIQALEKLRQCAPKNSKVKIDSLYKDRYGRFVAIVENNGKNCNEFLLDKGYAWVYTAFCKNFFCKGWRKRAKQAKNSKLGLWKKNNPIPPWTWRKINVK